MSLPLTAALMPVLVGFLAVSVDTAVLATSRAQLKTVADSAALAGAGQLANEYRLKGPTNISTHIANAQSAAKTTGQANSVLGQSAVLLDNSSNSASGDLVVGYVPPGSKNGAKDWIGPPLPPSVTPNSVRVTAIRDDSHAGKIPHFFSQLYGFRGSPMNVQSTATVWNHEIKGVTSLLPIVLHKDTYNAMIDTSTPATTANDHYGYDPVTGKVTGGPKAGDAKPDGVKESVLYPVPSGNPGNWGTVNIGVKSNSTKVLGDQIRDGLTEGQLKIASEDAERQAGLPAGSYKGTIQLDASKTPPSINFSGDPGISAGIKDDLASIIGRPVTIPIYDQSGGNGNNAWYRIIAFAGVRLLYVDLTGGNKVVIVQPAKVSDPSAIPGVPTDKWGLGGIVRLHLSQ